MNFIRKLQTSLDSFSVSAALLTCEGVGFFPRTGFGAIFAAVDVGTRVSVRFRGFAVKYECFESIS
jgi:hypothetical protein